jgi:hypothetical protein
LSFGKDNWRNDKTLRSTEGYVRESGRYECITGRRGSTCSEFVMAFEVNAGKAVTGFNAIERGIWAPSGLGLGSKKQRKI